VTTSIEPASPSHRLVGIDILRAVAVLSVLFVHVQIPESTPSIVKSVLAVLKTGGWIGVDLFFVLSGFLVSGLLFAEYERYGTLRPGRFLIRRGLKIYPAFYTMLLVTLLYAMLGWHQVTTRGFLGEVFFVQNYFSFEWGHTWTLAIEEHFYLLLTAALYLLARRGRRKQLGGGEAFSSLVPVYFIVAIACLTARAITYWAAIRAGSVPYFVATHLRIDELLFGVVLSYMWRFNGEGLRKFLIRHNRVIAVGIAAVLPLFFLQVSQFLVSTVGLLLLEVTFGALMLLILLRPIQLSLSAAFFRRIGIGSYSIYLWHLPWRDAIPHIMLRIGVPASAWPVTLLLYFAGSVVVGITAAALIEIPILRIRDRLLPSRSGTATTPASISGTTSDPAGDSAPVDTVSDVRATVA
jgi:peptidoglycan/LPS O-acetylase OafA/YrhL